MQKRKFSFEQMQLDHLELVHRWLQEPHVKEFWDDGHRSLEDVQRHYFYRSTVKSWIAHVDGLPFAYFQMALISDESEMSQWKSAEKSTVGIDMFIGEPQLVGKGLSVPLIQAFIKKCLLSYIPCRILFDPENTNPRAIAVYKKAGFETAGTFNHEGKEHTVLLKEISAGIKHAG